MHNTYALVHVYICIHASVLAIMLILENGVFYDIEIS